MICKCCGQEIKQQRTPTQNNALHLYFTLLAEALNESGLDLRTTLKKDAMIPWNTYSVKEYLWRPIQKAMVQKGSTTELDKTNDITQVYETLNRHLGDKFGIHVPFPSNETQILDS
jgi:hypothetical protein